MRYADKQRGLSREKLLELFHYDPSTGIFTNRTTRSSRAKKGMSSGTFTKDGYIQILIDYELYYAHRLAWLYVYDEWPDEQIDHKNWVGDDNRIDNLRKATRSQNSHNTGKPKVDNGLPKGVHPTRNGRYFSKITVKGKIHHLGTFTTAEAAGQAYQSASVKLHGDFSPFQRSK